MCASLDQLGTVLGVFLAYWYIVRPLIRIYIEAFEEWNWRRKGHGLKCQCSTCVENRIEASLAADRWTNRRGL